MNPWSGCGKIVTLPNGMCMCMGCSDFNAMGSGCLETVTYYGPCPPPYIPLLLGTAANFCVEVINGPLPNPQGPIVPGGGPGTCGGSDGPGNSAMYTPNKNNTGAPSVPCPPIPVPVPL